MADKATSRASVRGKDGIVKVVLLYATFAVLWILLSDRAVAWLFREPEQIIMAGMFKGLLFVAVTCLLLYRAMRGDVMGMFGVSRNIADLNRAEEAWRESAEINSAIVTQAKEGIVLVDCETLRFVEFNDAACNGLGYSREEFAQLTLFDIQGILTREEFTERIRAVVEVGDSKFENQQRRKDGSLCDVLLSNRVICVRSRKYLVALWQDITERKSAEKALHESELRLRTILQTVNEGFWLIDNDTATMDLNPRMCEILDRKWEEVLGKKIFDFADDKNRVIFEHQIGLRVQGKVGAYEIALSRPDGSKVFCMFNSTPLYDRSGNKVGSFAMVTDISDRKHAEQEKEKLETELYQARKMEAIGLLAGGIAHDFNNMLAAIMGFTELSLFRLPEDNPVRANLEQVLKAASRASGVVKQILTFTRQGVQERKPVRIAPIVLEALKLLRSSLPSTIEIRQEIAIRPGEDVVLADPGQINQLLMNFGTNAGHAMRTKGGALTVKLSAITDASQLSIHPDLKAGPHVCITVSDTGHGMDSAVLERIFDPYFTTKGPGEGTGLGLSVVQGIVKSHNGAITVTSEPGQGTTFFVFLPGLGNVYVEDDKASQTLLTGSERILLVDDEEALVDLGKKILEALGYQVTSRTSSLDALETFRAQPYAFDLVITDMTMPNLTGRELTEKIIAIRSDTPIILSTGFSDPANEEQAREAGIREFIMKPYEIRTLAGAIRRALEQQKKD